MGIYTERLRQMIKNAPDKDEMRHLKPEQFSMVFTMLTNASLQVVGHLEEALVDMENENARLTERLIESGLIDTWKPNEGELT